MMLALLLSVVGESTQRTTHTTHNLTTHLFNVCAVTTLVNQPSFNHEKEAVFVSRQQLNRLACHLVQTRDRAEVWIFGKFSVRDVEVGKLTSDVCLVWGEGGTEAVHVRFGTVGITRVETLVREQALLVIISKLIQLLPFLTSTQYNLLLPR